MPDLLFEYFYQLDDQFIAPMFWVPPYKYMRNSYNVPLVVKEQLMQLMAPVEQRDVCYGSGEPFFHPLHILFCQNVGWKSTQGNVFILVSLSPLTDSAILKPQNLSSCAYIRKEIQLNLLYFLYDTISKHMTQNKYTCMYSVMAPSVPCRLQTIQISRCVFLYTECLKSGPFVVYRR